MTDTIAINYRRYRRSNLADVFFWAIALLLLFFNLGSRGLWTVEGRWAEVAREMLHTGDFFHPQINGEPYFDKPLLTYWLIVLISYFTNQLNEWVVRMPSALSGMLSLFCVRYLGRRLYNKEVGDLAGWILLTTYGFLFWARTGTAD
ncbi:MAG: phospholipid carrier-dependent glycosyltransferase, partial [Nitrospirae bacterium]